MYQYHPGDMTVAVMVVGFAVGAAFAVAQSWNTQLKKAQEYRKSESGLPDELNLAVRSSLDGPKMVSAREYNAFMRQEYGTRKVIENIYGSLPHPCSHYLVMRGDGPTCEPLAAELATGIPWAISGGMCLRGTQNWILAKKLARANINKLKEQQEKDEANVN